MGTPISVEDITDAVKHMSQEDRQDLLLQLAQIDELMDDLEDISDILKSKSEPSRPFGEFIDELRTEGRDI